MTTQWRVVIHKAMMLVKTAILMIRDCLPAIQALIRETHVPVNKALSTKDDMSPFFCGQIEAVE